MAPSNLPDSIHISTHPCLRAKLSQLRSQTTDSRSAKLLIHEISLIVGCEALSAVLTTVPTGAQGQTPIGAPYALETISPRSISLIPILRSGLSMLDALSSLLPFACPTHHLGLFRNKQTLEPVEYYNNLPFHQPTADPPSAAAASSTTTENSSGAEAKSGVACDLALILDPIIATGNTAAAAIDTLREWGAKRVVVIAVLASRRGVEHLAATFAGANVEVFVGAVDEGELDARGMIRPGLGDVGDRLFLTLGM